MFTDEKGRPFYKCFGEIANYSADQPNSKIPGCESWDFAYVFVFVLEYFSKPKRTMGRSVSGDADAVASAAHSAVGASALYRLVPFFLSSFVISRFICLVLVVARAPRRQTWTTVFFVFLHWNPWWLPGSAGRSRPTGMSGLWRWYCCIHFCVHFSSLIPTYCCTGRLGFLRRHSRCSGPIPLRV